MIASLTSLLLLPCLPALQRGVGLFALLAPHVSHASARGSAAKAGGIHLC